MAHGRLIVIAGPSGVGKGSLVRRLVARDPDGPVLSVSATTREPRAGEIDRVDYRFASEDEFDQMIERGDLLEWAAIVGHRSGTPRAFVTEQLDAGRDVILEIDVEGARQIRERMPEALLIFLVPPSFEELERRLRGRGTEDEELIRRRLDTSAWEMDQRDWFDHEVINDDLVRATDEVAAIIEASHTL
ncbi:MAG: guanylate kinase [Actinomycetota bacterium]